MSVWLPTAPCTPGDCAVHRGPATGPVTAVGRLLAGCLLVLAGALLTPLLAPLPGGTRDRLTRRWCRTVLRLFGLRVHVRGAGAAPARGTGVLVVANHISWLDIPLLAAVFPARMLAKSEIGRWPVLGALAARGGTLFVERERLRALPATVGALAAALTAGSRVAVFPEGCTWCGQDQGPFTRAVFQAALDAGAAVRPVRITYRTERGTPSGAPAYIGDDSLPASLWRVVTAGGLTAEITVLPLIPAGRHTDRRSLAEAARSAVTGSAAGRPGPAHTAVASDSANRSAPSVHQYLNSIPAPRSSSRTRS
ncbi:lysophospholipid acyltransferase family protein [Streptomyces corynorhini]|uniref:1-acyl-sn-glycerol-3-phosphate acyltransferase n=1 Tax=Streptomyces corynorhini TaxID=2282652 RepID=A0A370B387_9ACTN|nr:lysophospholipid acyltransferase family protein [Streptomyces corynorhini]RDG35132.1 1-acyl-sn-glycerol-3-phosphate acyltransferase [Streptomyces corynorhini]